MNRDERTSNRRDLHVNRRIQCARMWAEGAAKPWVDQIVRIRMLERPTYELRPDGLRLVSDGLTDREHEMIRQCEEAIATIHRQAEQLARVP
jgi:hypothetical protein